MNPVKFPEANVNYGAPADWDPATQGECGALPVYQIDGRCLSVWRPTPQERQIIARGGDIALIVAGRQVPVILTAIGPSEGDIIDFSSPT